MRPAMRASRRKTERTFKFGIVVTIITFYWLFSTFIDPPVSIIIVRTTPGALQNAAWRTNKPQNETKHANEIAEAARDAFRAYRDHAFGYEDIDPLSGKGRGEKDGGGGYLIEAAPTLALMGMWEDFKVCLKHIIHVVDFTRGTGVVDPAMAASRYLGALVTLVEMYDAEMIPEKTMDKESREAVLRQATMLADKLKPSFRTESGLPFPRLDFESGQGRFLLQEEMINDAQVPNTTDPAHAASLLLEHNALSRLTSTPGYAKRAQKALSPYILNKVEEDPVGLVLGPIDISTGAPKGTDRHWDTGHGLYYDVLIKALILDPKDPLASNYQLRWNQSANAVRWNLSSRSVPTVSHPKQHLYLGHLNGKRYFNEMSQRGCAAAGTLLHGGTALSLPSFKVLGLALLEACHQIYTSSPAELGTERWSWLGMPLSPQGALNPSTQRSEQEIEKYGYWALDARFTFDPSYFSSLFFAYRITGEARFRTWAWEAFEAIQDHCKTPYGFAGLKDVMHVTTKQIPSERLWGDVKSGDVLMTLRWLWLIFADTDVASLDQFVITNTGNILKRD